MSPIPDFTADERSRVEELLARRYGEPVAVDRLIREPRLEAVFGIAPGSSFEKRR